jgi:hypothetical protein
MDMKRFACASVTLLMGVAGCAHSTSHYEVRVLRPLGGTITSVRADGQPDGKIRCGSAPEADACGPSEFAAGEKAMLKATPDEEFVFEEWAADCSGQGSCVLDAAGGERKVAACFAPAESN